MMRTPHWADVLNLRDEIIATGGQISDLQMSLYSAAYTDRDVPYQDPIYYSDITEPTVSLVSFIGAVARRLGTKNSAGKALFHLDQGMGGGKSHALVGLYHLGKNPQAFFATELGRQIAIEAERQGALGLTDSRVIVLSADNMTPGATSPEFGPAKTLYERFLWSLFRGDKPAYRRHLAEGPNKAALARALEASGRPVLILLDELMDYAMLLSDQRHIGTMPGEKAFLNNLMDAVDDVPQVAFVLVMIRSDLDERGYTVEAEEFRGYVASRLERNGTTVAVTEAQDFSAIIRRRLFERSEKLPISELALEWRSAVDATWKAQVFDHLGATRNLASFADRLSSSYPFHPDLMTLVREDWSRHAGFQRVRSTVEIFAATANHWMNEHRQGRWAPRLIGVGDIPLAVAIEHVLSSGLLHGNERAVQGFRQVAATDVVNKDGTKGRARELDSVLPQRGISAKQPAPAQRIATAIYCYSLVPRAHAKRGATKAELLAAVFEPGLSFQVAEEIFNVVTSDEEGLGALEIMDSGGGNTPARFQLAVTQTLRMFFKQAKASVDPADRDLYLWDRAKAIANRGPFDRVIPISQPDIAGAPLGRIFGDVDQNGETRLVVLDLRRWTLLNGKDTPTRDDITSLFGIGANSLPVDNAASCVVACVNTQRRDSVRKRAADVLAWKSAILQLGESDEKRAEAQAELRTATERVDADLQKAFQHFAYIVRSDKAEVEWKRFDDDSKTSLKGSHVWEALVEAGRATRYGSLSSTYLDTLLKKLRRDLTLKEIVQQFYKNPAFPLLSNIDDVRHAIFELLENNYELVGGDGVSLSIASQDELALGSMEQMLRLAIPRNALNIDTPTDHKVMDNSYRSGVVGLTKVGKPAVYRVYRLEVQHRSIIDLEVRGKLANLLTELAETVDPEIGGDVQLIDVKVELTADRSAVEKLSSKASEAEAKWTEREADF